MILSVTLFLINQSLIQRVDEHKKAIDELQDVNNRIVQYMVELVLFLHLLDCRLWKHRYSFP